MSLTQVTVKTISDLIQEEGFFAQNEILPGNLIGLFSGYLYERSMAPSFLEPHYNRFRDVPNFYRSQFKALAQFSSVYTKFFGTVDREAPEKLDDYVRLMHAVPDEVKDELIPRSFNALVLGQLDPYLQQQYQFIELAFLSRYGALYRTVILSKLDGIETKTLYPEFLPLHAKATKIFQ